MVHLLKSWVETFLRKHIEVDLKLERMKVGVTYIHPLATREIVYTFERRYKFSYDGHTHYNLHVQLPPET